MGVPLSGLVTLGLVFLLSVCLNEQTAEGCSCLPEHPQQLFCSADTVFQAEVTGQEIKPENEIFPEWGLIQYTIKIIKVFKGSERLKEIQYVYTPKQIGLCGVELSNRQYLLSGNIMHGGVVVSLCNLVELWDSLSSIKKSYLNSTYQIGCNCTISVCSETPCPTVSDRDCPWTDWSLYVFSQDGEQAREYACIESSNGSCAWFKGTFTTI